MVQSGAQPNENEMACCKKIGAEALKFVSRFPEFSASLRGKLLLAPMVRVTTLPFRLLARMYGADFTFTPEIIDHKLVGAERIENPLLGTIDYVQRDRVVLRLLESERDHLVLQLGSSNASRALEAARTVASDIACVDLNCGCPKHFSVHDGMGAALMSNPCNLCDILETLVSGSGVPVTAKLRVFEDPEKSISLYRKVIATGVAGIAVHCRTRDDRPSKKGNWNTFSYACKAAEDCTVNVTANGDIRSTADIAKCLGIPGVSSVMLARGALANPSVFRFPEPPVPLLEVMREYIKIAVSYAACVQNVKCVLSYMLSENKVSASGALNQNEGKSVHARQEQGLPLMETIHKCKTLEEVATELGVRDRVIEIMAEVENRAQRFSPDERERYLRNEIV